MRRETPKLSKRKGFLQGAYRHFNKLYFGKTLPTDTKVLWVNDERIDGDMGWTLVESKRIWISRELKKFPLVALQVLLHEMCHIKRPRSHNHGPSFTRELRRLIVAGAFDPLL